MSQEAELIRLREEKINLESELLMKDSEMNKTASEMSFLREEFNKMKNEQDANILKKEKEKMGIEIIDVSTIDSLEKVRKLHLDLLQKYSKLIEKRGESGSNDETDNEIRIEFDHFKRFLQEYEITNNLDHPSIIHAFGFGFGDSTHSPSRN
ncbi:hypothetical protein M9Y10_039488 [Tritrichomonas musculus]|uniref:Uncharacterized protein n=1 Tax=Tritrichomonas musculus TaxID=1915356 RepID=A0ABR2KC18_9EUKA